MLIMFIANKIVLKNDRKVLQNLSVLVPGQYSGNIIITLYCAVLKSSSPYNQSW